MDSLENFGLNGHLYREETQLSVLYIKLTPMMATHETQRLTSQEVKKKTKTDSIEEPVKKLVY